MHIRGEYAYTAYVKKTLASGPQLLQYFLGPHILKLFSLEHLRT